MRYVIASLIATGILISMTCSAQAPAGSTGECKDGSYTSAASKRGACKGHGGVKEWYENAASKAAATPSTASPSKTPGSTATAPASSGSSPTVAPAAKSSGTTKPSAAAGGGPGQVWVNSKTKVYHCQGDKWYGKTKEGEYMSEAAAKAAGNRADHGKACS